MTFRILVVELEPAPYKYDLWNAFVQQGKFDVKVLFSRGKDWRPDGSHDFSQYPKALFNYKSFYGKGIYDFLSIMYCMFDTIIRWKPQLVMISGYVDKEPLAALFICLLTHTKYTIHSDVFNNDGIGKSFLSKLKVYARTILRRIIFSTATAVLNCGRQGVDSAIRAGCSKDKAYDFPYVVDRDRLLSDMPNIIPDACLSDLDSRNIIILFSGRFIPRKGVESLLKAISEIKNNHRFIVWLEGQGPDFGKMLELAEGLGISPVCRFLGFSQMSLHSWLIRHADIVVVPSIQDSWGIVVDEGMQLGKPVISTTNTGSALERISDNSNGIIVKPGDVLGLRSALNYLIDYDDERHRIGSQALLDVESIGPKKNVSTILEIISRMGC